MNVSGHFTTASSAEALASLSSTPAALNQVSTLEDVVVDANGDVRARFVPVTALGRFVLRVTISTVAQDNRGARLRVIARSGTYRVSADIALAFVAGDVANAVTWDAEVAVRGAAASVGQRVARDIAQHVIGEVLAESADAARQPA